MTDEIRNKMLAILAKVDELKARDTALSAERAGHIEQITQSEQDLKRTDDGIRSLRDDERSLKNELNSITNELFGARPEEMSYEDVPEELRDRNYVKPPWTATPHRKGAPINSDDYRVFPKAN
jgi:chromosome segregation ATPase